MNRSRMWIGSLVVISFLVAGIYVFALSSPGKIDVGNLVYPLARIEEGVTRIDLHGYGLDEWTMLMTDQDGVLNSSPVRHLYIVHNEGDYLVLSGLDPFMGCSIVWQERKDSFLNPCHGQLYSIRGERIDEREIGAHTGMSVVRSQVVDNNLVIEGHFELQDGFVTDS